MGAWHEDIIMSYCLQNLVVDKQLPTPSARPGMTYKLDSGTGRCRGDQFSDRVRL